MLNKIIFSASFILLVCCKRQEVYERKLNSNQEIPPGEWVSNSDLHSGLSVRGNKIAFYENEKFTSDDIFKYSIIDSVKIQDKNKTVLSTYLKKYDSNDTIYYKILNRSNTNISLMLKRNLIENYRLKKNETSANRR